MARRLNKELSDLQNNPTDFATAGPVGEDLLHWNAMLMGPPNTPYDGGVFNVDLVFPAEYPFKPPKVRFLTKVYHPNIKSNGEICADLVNDSWGPTLNTRYVLSALKGLLEEPNVENPLEPEIAAQYKNKHNEFVEEAKKWTREYAC